MRHNNLTVFDDMISGSGSVYTSTEYNSKLGLYDQLAIGVVIDNVSGSPAFDLWIEHSSDARNWLQRNDTGQANPPPAVAGSGDITVSSLSSGSTLFQMFSDPGIIAVSHGNARGFPLLTFVRFHMLLSGNSAHVKVHVTQRS